MDLKNCNNVTILAELVDACQLNSKAYCISWLTSVNMGDMANKNVTEKIAKALAATLDSTITKTKEFGHSFYYG